MTQYAKLASSSTKLAIAPVCLFSLSRGLLKPRATKQTPGMSRHDATTEPSRLTCTKRSMPRRSATSERVSATTFERVVAMRLPTTGPATCASCSTADARRIASATMPPVLSDATSRSGMPRKAEAGPDTPMSTAEMRSRSEGAAPRPGAEALSLPRSGSLRPRMDMSSVLAEGEPNRGGSGITARCRPPRTPELGKRRPRQNVSGR